MKTTITLLLLLAGSCAFADTTALTYDPAGNIVSRTTGAASALYSYDALNLLISESGPAKTQGFAYDADGNRLSDGSGSYAYGPASNKLATRKGVAVTTDAAGHITSDGLGHSFAYNQAGRLYQVYQGTTLLASYYYDFKGERTRKVTTAAAPQGAGTVFYHYDEAGHLLEESAGNGSPIRTYIWRDDVPLAQIDHVPSRRVLYFDVDQLNTPRAARDQAGNVVWRWESDAFGSTAPTANAGVVVNLRFPGQYYDQESGLDYNQNRDYDPNSGRYAESDPIGLKGGVNTYAYVNGNPLSRIDPNGLRWQFSQSTGQWSYVNDQSGAVTPVGQGYSGTGAGRNNPAMQNVPNTGPTPQGTYNIGPGHRSPNTGPNTMNLTPQTGTDTHGRDFLRIHGDNAEHDASHGCAIAPPNVRTQINNSTDRVLQVVP